MSKKKPQRTIFISHSRKDKAWADRLRLHLGVFDDSVDVWQDSSIRPGDNWMASIREAISNADAAILLISPDYLASEFVTEAEIPNLLKTSKKGTMMIMPVMVRPTHIPPDHPIYQYQFANSPDQPLSGLSESAQDQVFARIASIIGEAARKPVSRKLEPKTSASLADEIAAKVAELLATNRTDDSSNEETKSKRKNTNSNLVFVIASFAEEMEPIYEGIEAAAKAVGLEAKRVKDVPGDYRITDKILEMILSCRIVVADLTLERPNVYFELGYTRGIGKTVITIARRDTKIHFDVKDWTYIPYIDSRILERELKERFEYELEREK